MGSSSGYNLHRAIGLCAVLLLAGCHGNQQQSANTGDQSQQEQASSDPASANLVPAVYTAGSSSTAQNAPSSDYDNGSSQPYDDSADESDYGIAPDETAPDPPPPLPDYDQPPCPGDGYLWTPGYWDYASTGYYWVPGAWVEAPYQGALWTPGYWAYSRGRYAFFHGYWGPHIGFYGGINYGFGYVGIGYQGGYWNSGHFDYNRSVNNINVNVVHNVYNYKVVNVNNRVSFNGGSGGVERRPRPTELAALREPHAPPMHAQIEMRQSASVDHAQFASVNRGRPQQFTAPHPIVADHNVRPVEAHGLRNLPAPAPRPVAQAYPNAAPNPAPPNPAPMERAEPGRPEPNPQAPNHPEPNRVMPGPPEQNRPAPNHPEPNRLEPNHAQTAPPSHAAPAPVETAHPAPERREAPPEQRPQPTQPAPPEHRQPPSHPAPEQHAPMPEQHAAPNHPAPEQHAAPPSHPAPEEHKQPQSEHKDDHPHL
jgi:hypothetical protein